ncbi:MAG: hypothetical protein M5R36_27850 [Deltaproteobacteria bacterium]|nr:hypothetical protein [Deltaproteobacteria bacterium]
MSSGCIPRGSASATTKAGREELLRIGYERGGKIYFVNFMAVTSVRDRDGEILHNGSELLMSPSDGKPGLRFYAYPDDYKGQQRQVSQTAAGAARGDGSQTKRPRDDEPRRADRALSERRAVFHRAAFR